MISAIILAAGQSRRMGQPKMLLPWGEGTVLGQVITTFQKAGVDELLVVTGGHREQVGALVGKSARAVFNPQYEQGEMLSSIQCGITELKPETQAILIALGDQPQVQERSVRTVMEAYRQSRSPIVVPSFQMRRGHPWLVARLLWDEILEMKYPQTPRDFLNSHAHEIKYVTLDNDSIIQDLDTPDDYLKSRP